MPVWQTNPLILLEIGTTPGDTTVPRQELADVDCGSSTGEDARPGMGRNRKAGLRSKPAVRDWRGPTADDAAPIVSSMGSTTDDTRRSPRWSAGRRGVPQGTSPHPRCCANRASISPLVCHEREKRNEAQPARRSKRAAERWLLCSLAPRRKERRAAHSQFLSKRLFRQIKNPPEQETSAAQGDCSSGE